jgi:hypothetical protein
MDIKYRTHAVERMIQRKISTKEVELILTSPDGKIKQSMDKIIYYKDLKGRKDNSIAAVTLLLKDRDYEILTVMIDFEVK